MFVTIDYNHASTEAEMQRIKIDSIRKMYNNSDVKPLSPKIHTPAKVSSLCNICKRSKATIRVLSLSRSLCLIMKDYIKDERVQYMIG